MTHQPAWWPTLIVVAIATVTDLRSRRIPNWLVLPFLVGGLIFSAVHGGWHGFVQGLEGMALGTLILGFMFWMGGMGAGDVKLCAAIGAWIGPNQLIFALFVTAFAGGLMAIAYVLYRKGKQIFLAPKQAVNTEGSSADGSEEAPKVPRPRLSIPYAPAIAVGTLFSFFPH